MDNNEGLPNNSVGVKDLPPTEIKTRFDEQVNPAFSLKERLDARIGHGNEVSVDARKVLGEIPGRMDENHLTSDERELVLDAQNTSRIVEASNRDRAMVNALHRSGLNDDQIETFLSTHDRELVQIEEEQASQSKG